MKWKKVILPNYIRLILYMPAGYSFTIINAHVHVYVCVYSCRTNFLTKINDEMR